MKVLIVEDDPILVRIYTVRLKKEGFETEVVTNGEDALASIRKRVPDVMLLDLVMPKMDGFSLLAELKKEGIDLPPTVVLSNLDQSADIHKAKEMGVVDYVVKGKADLEEIARKIAQFAKK
jgi:DNA-binding response OmpR family regulator